mgnify:CR=1 FL=1
MINNIISFSIRNKLLVGLFTIGLIAMGIWSLSKVPLDAVPDITNNQVQIITQAPTLSTEDIEQLVTYPIEISMANLPGVEEIRSVSRFGLSLVTIVFEDDMGIYLPRQLVFEKLEDVKTQIPKDIGDPEIGPISTGLGEILQYTLEVDSAFKDKYSLSDLRETQDWIIRRQMAMVKGVVEVNAFGGNIKQYEVTVNPNSLKAMNLSLLEVFNALEANNQNTGGAYIEKNNQAHFIRGEGLIRNLDDIRKIVVKNINGIPITIETVGEVNYGKAIRFGAFTKDGKGEAVGGMILMLKGANSNEVIKDVKERIVEIQKSLPEGIQIKPFLDRSKLIEKTTTTVGRNLLEGALIVIFVLVFLLGNWRGGLIVASTIPLSLLFAFILMHQFGVWANLMSLGAIDFGIIIDGAVIIVEGTVFMFSQYVLKNKALSPAKRDKLSLKASSKMMNSAFFGQLIILIVFIPILSLEGIEGKMFKPMALTFMFSMIGIMVLCLTYVPMMSAWLLKVDPKQKESWGDKIVKAISKSYGIILEKVLAKSKLVFIAAVVIIGIAGWGFSKLGAEFIPILDEGDIAFHDILKPGSSLSKTIEITTKVEKMIMDNFPEVESVLSRIGVADVPTDPMPMDVADCFIILKPIKEWKSGWTKPELVEEIRTKVLEMPGINYEFSQPIEMRFNELITGVREDLAIKVFGDDLDILAKKGEEISKLIKGIEGVSDLKAEATQGQPQLTVHYNRNKLAQYGLNVTDLNFMIQSSFAGAHAGQIFEGEKRFELVLRLNKEQRSDIDDLKALFIKLKSGDQIPLKELAEISYEPGPMQISRENTNRRTYVGINVRGRDIKSLVEEIQLKLDSELDLPSGYYIRYGGAFENLQRATNRLKFVVPIALGLIFLLIFLALKSFKQTSIIYLAIPMAATGGVFSLWLRDMPFSISAGIGFIVLFGIAVLNGLVLISGWNELKEEGITDLKERIRLGTQRRIRPILLTAITDILGFLPMAISSSAGAEVQRPLATVVIGGMVTATLLTLFILPILYQWIEKNGTRKKPKSKLVVGLILILVFPSLSQAQEFKRAPLGSLDSAIAIGIKNNEHIQSSLLAIRIAESEKGKAFDIDKTQVDFQYGQFNSSETDIGITISQEFKFPTVYGRQRKIAKLNKKYHEANALEVQNQMKFQIRSIWNDLAFQQKNMEILLMEDSASLKLVRFAEIKFETDEISIQEKLKMQNQYYQLKNKIIAQQAIVSNLEDNLNFLLNDSVYHTFKAHLEETYPLSLVKSNSIESSNSQILKLEKELSISEVENSLAKHKILPDFRFGYVNQTFLGGPLANGQLATSSDRFTGLLIGIRVPLFFASFTSDIKASRLRSEQKQVEFQQLKRSIETQEKIQIQKINYLRIQLDYYHNYGLKEADLIWNNSSERILADEINYLANLESLRRMFQIHEEYAQALNSYNEAIIEFLYLKGQ